MPPAWDLTKAVGLKTSRPCQMIPPDGANNSDAVMFAFSTRYADSFMIVDRDDPSKEIMRAAESAPSTVCPVESISRTELSSADDIIEAKPEDIFMRQLVIFKTKDGRDYRFEKGQIDTGNDAEFMLIGKRLIKKLGLKEEPLLGHIELQGINGPRFRPTSFVRLRFKMPRLELDWVNVIAYVVDSKIGFNLGNRAISKFGLLAKLQELEQAGKGWVNLRRRGTNSTARAINIIISKRSKAQKREDARRHQERSSLAAEISLLREQSQRTAASRLSSSQTGQSTYSRSSGPYSTSATTAPSSVDVASSSHASTWSTSATAYSMESSDQKRTT